MSIAACWNVYNDAKALRGSLELASSYFDNLFVIHSGPGGAHSTDGTIELLHEFGISPIFADIQEGYGVIRTRLIHECGCDWAFIMDADERFHPALQIMRCEGSERYPAQQNPNLTVRKSDELIFPGLTLKETIKNPAYDGVKAIRRHWMDFSMSRPAENWIERKDWQLRIVRNRGEIQYKSGVRMHEQLIDTRTGQTPRHFTGDDYGGPFFDHFHMHFRRAFPGTKEENERRYERLSRGEPMLA